MLIFYPYVFLGEVSAQVFCPFFFLNWVICFLILNCYSPLFKVFIHKVNTRILVPYQILVLQIFSPRLSCLFISLKTVSLGNSLAVQLLELHTFTAEGLGSIPDWRTKITQAPQATWHGQKQKQTNKQKRVSFEERKFLILMKSNVSFLFFYGSCFLCPI